MQAIEIIVDLSLEDAEAAIRTALAASECSWCESGRRFFRPQAGIRHPHRNRCRRHA